MLRPSNSSTPVHTATSRTSRITFSRGPLAPSPISRRSLSSKIAKAARSISSASKIATCSSRSPAARTSAATHLTDPIVTPCGTAASTRFSVKAAPSECSDDDDGLSATTGSAGGVCLPDDASDDCGVGPLVATALIGSAASSTAETFTSAGSVACGAAFASRSAFFFAGRSSSPDADVAAAAVSAHRSLASTASSRASA
mmetsp:Transcript_8320/g.26580  ORF Transcript_8320/g.26580 Transcript_8320/m.26580 type:complete len:200 (-) Transcript_8320:1639-2238(-)